MTMTEDPGQSVRLRIQARQADFAADIASEHGEKNLASQLRSLSARLRRMAAAPAAANVEAQ